MIQGPIPPGKSYFWNSQRPFYSLGLTQIFLTQRILDDPKGSKHFSNSQSMKQTFKSGHSEASSSSADSEICNKSLQLLSSSFLISKMRWKDKMTFRLLLVLKLYKLESISLLNNLLGELQSIYTWSGEKSTDRKKIVLGRGGVYGWMHFFKKGIRFFLLGTNRFTGIEGHTKPGVHLFQARIQKDCPTTANTTSPLRGPPDGNVGTSCFSKLCNPACGRLPQAK